MASVDTYHGAGSRRDWDARTSIPFIMGGSPTASASSDVSRVIATQEELPSPVSANAVPGRTVDDRDSDETTSPKTSAGGRCPSRYDWSKHMPTIKQLYIEEDKTLKEVMGIMEKEHNFIATARMYKIRLKKWGYTKNVSVKSEEIEPLLRLLDEAESKGDARATSSEVQLATGRVVGLDRLAAHLRRKAQRQQHNLAVDTRAASQASTSLTRYRRGESPSPVSLAINSPEMYRISEIVFADVHAYVCGRILEPKGLQLVQRSDYDMTSPVFSMVHAASEFLKQGRLNEALALLRVAPARLKNVIMYEPPNILHCLFMVIVHLLSTSGSEQLVSSIKALLAYAAATADENSRHWSPQYPVRRILRSLADLSASKDFHLRDMTVHAWRCLLRSHDLTLGSPDCARTFPNWLDLGESAGFDVLPSELLEKMHWEVYRKRVAEFGEGDMQSWSQLFYLSELERQKVKARGTTSARLQQYLEMTLVGIENARPGQGLVAKYNCQHSLAEIYNDQGQRDLSESFLRAAIDTAAVRHGRNDERVLQMLFELENRLAEWGEGDDKLAEPRERSAGIIVALNNEC
ncbi:hypothetical protein N8I77_002879 [Diaporthe amygdali]|uniref:Clr5 domain-containing protein n=1 Tax=Phomopsis amygdali TaxID=1214568 RepID=A0AAD9S0N0_PHOAM|nr:hypothetical protein N8I77_013704 [Diaporthe amygdali]KAK2595680.1 hypothetical protein N8I77_013705 [Diaporthe amygdali]KAK2609382.1 hypothetical protein N8I77_002879 [Diaporthe amygdali]